MTKDELIEQLADAEHASWARWMQYLFSRCEDRYDIDADGSYMGRIIPPELVGHWRRQVETPYKDLSEREKQSDRDEVAHILPIIEEYEKQRTRGVQYTTTLKWIENNGIEHTFQSKSENEVYTKGSELLADYLLCKIREYSVEAGS